MNKNTTVILVVIVVIGVGVGAYFIFRPKTDAPKDVKTTTNETKTGLSSLLGNLNLSSLGVLG